MNLLISGAPFLARGDIETLHYTLAEHASMCWLLYQPVGRANKFNRNQQKIMYLNKIEDVGMTLLTNSLLPTCTESHQH